MLLGCATLRCLQRSEQKNWRTMATRKVTSGKALQQTPRLPSANSPWLKPDLSLTRQQRRKPTPRPKPMKLRRTVHRRRKRGTTKNLPTKPLQKNLRLRKQPRHWKPPKRKPAKLKKSSRKRKRNFSPPPRPITNRAQPIPFRR